MASSLITSWQIDGETMKTVTDFIFLGSKVTADGDFSHEIKRHLLLGRKAMIDLDCTLKSRDITLLTKIHLVSAMVFPVIMYGYESWTIKKTEHWRTDAFELWCWRWLLRVPWRARRSNLNIHQKDWCWSWSSNTLATWCEQLTHWKRPWCWERLKAGGKGMTEDEMVGWHHQLGGWVWASSGCWWLTGRHGMLQSMGSQRIRHDWVTELNKVHVIIYQLRLESR